MVCVRKHVENPCAAQAIVLLLDEDARIPGERGRMTGHVDDSLWRNPPEFGNHGFGTRARRIENDDIPRFAHEAPVAFRKVGGQEARVLDAVALRVARGARDESRVALNAKDGACVPRERQAEVAETAIQIENAVTRLGPRGRNDLGDHSGIDYGVDLHEIGRGELELDVEVPQ